MEMEASMANQAMLHLLMFVCAVIVHDQMEVQVEEKLCANERPPSGACRELRSMLPACAETLLAGCTPGRLGRPAG